MFRAISPSFATHTSNPFEIRVVIDPEGGARNVDFAAIAASFDFAKQNLVKIRGGPIVGIIRRRGHVENSLDELQLGVIAGFGEIPEFLKGIGFDQGRGRDHHDVILEHGRFRG
jgi:hypothetical protein